MDHVFITFYRFVGGHAESKACVTEALTTALACFDELGRADTPTHVLLICCSPPYSAYAGGLVPPGNAAKLQNSNLKKHFIYQKNLN